MAADTSCSIGVASQVRMGAMDALFIETPLLVSRYKAQFRRSFPGDCRGYFRTETRGFATESSHHISHREAGWDEHVHQKVPAIRGGRNILDEQIGETLANVPVSKCEV